MACFLVYLGLAITLNLIDNEPEPEAIPAAETIETPAESEAPTTAPSSLTVPSTQPANDS